MGSILEPFWNNLIESKEQGIMKLGAGMESSWFSYLSSKGILGTVGNRGIQSGSGSSVWIIL